MKLSFKLTKLCLLILLGLANSLASVKAQPNGTTEAISWSSNEIPWASIVSDAYNAVGEETSDRSFPFERPSAEVAASSKRKVYSLYFPFFLISMDNKPLTEDHWAQHYLIREGEGGKYFNAGGFARERPLPVGPWKSPYWQVIDETVDIIRAHAMGLDGFGVGIQEPGKGHTYDISESLCYAAAKAVPGFRIFAEPDTTAGLNDVSSEDFAHIIKRYDTCPAILKQNNGHGLIAPFHPGLKSITYWQDVLQRLKEAGDPVDFIPVLLDPLRYAADFAPISAGISFWGNSDPGSLTDKDAVAWYKKLLAAAPMTMRAIKPQDSRPKQAMFSEARNTENFRISWMQAIESDATIAHLITWNDYSEATEISPSSGTQFLFYDLSAYYIAWFKTGHPPKILRDAIYYCHRNQIFDPDNPPRPTDTHYKNMGTRTPLANDIEMLAMLTSPAILEIKIGDKTYQEKADIGLSSFRVPAAPGRPIFRIIRDGKVSVEKLSDWNIDEKPAVLSPLYFGGSSTRAFVPLPQKQ